MISQKMLDLGKKSSVIREIFEYGKITKRYYYSIFFN